MQKIHLAYTGIAALFLMSIMCNGNNPEPEPDPCSQEGISYKLDGNPVTFNNSQVTAEIYHDAAIGKFYDIWTDENGGFYFHSTITEDGETAPFASNWFVTQDVANITFLNNKSNVNMEFKIIRGASNTGDRVTIEFSGTYEENNNIHTISDGLICTEIDINH